MLREKTMSSQSYAYAREHSHDYRDRKHRTANQSIGRGLGWFSVALGAAELLFAPGFARALGMPAHRAWLIRAYGVRELVTGLGILGAKRDMTPWLWARVAGDGLDLGTLAAHAGGDNPRRVACGAAMAAVTGVALLDTAAAQASASRQQHAQMAQHDYSDRSGLPQGVAASRGAAGDFEVPRDMRTPEAMRPHAMH
jgi:hypothetical protein